MTAHPKASAAAVPLDHARPSRLQAGGAPGGRGLVPEWARARWLAHHILPKERAICAWLARRCPPDLDPHDVLQETYAILAALPCVDHITNPLSYAFQVARSLLLRHHRRARILPMTGDADPEDLQLAADEPSPEQQVADREELDLVAGLVAALPARCQEVFVLRRIQGLSQRAVAQQMGVSEGTVEKHMSRALRLLAAAISAGPIPLLSRSMGSVAGPARQSAPPPWSAHGVGGAAAPQQAGESTRSWEVG